VVGLRRLLPTEGASRNAENFPTLVHEEDIIFPPGAYIIDGTAQVFYRSSRYHNIMDLFTYIPLPIWSVYCKISV